MFGWGQDVWDLILSTTEFAYNNSVNRSTGQSPFQIVNGYSPRTPIDLVPLPPHMRVSKLAKNIAKHVHDLYAEIRRKISQSNEEYKLAADVHRRSKEFNVGDSPSKEFNVGDSPSKEFKLAAEHVHDLYAEHLSAHVMATKHTQENI